MTSRTAAEQSLVVSDEAPAPSGTKLQIVEAALRTLKTKGFAGASARAIAGEGNFNQALIFYHFGSVRNLLLAGLDLVSERRMSAYATAFAEAILARAAAKLRATIEELILDYGLDRESLTIVGGGVASLSKKTVPHRAWCGTLGPKRRPG